MYRSKAKERIYYEKKKKPSKGAAHKGLLAGTLKGKQRVKERAADIVNNWEQETEDG